MLTLEKASLLIGNPNPDPNLLTLTLTLLIPNHLPQTKELFVHYFIDLTVAKIKVDITKLVLGIGWIISAFEGGATPGERHLLTLYYH